MNTLNNSLNNSNHVGNRNSFLNYKKNNEKNLLFSEYKDLGQKNFINLDTSAISSKKSIGKNPNINVNQNQMKLNIINKDESIEEFSRDFNDKDRKDSLISKYLKTKN